MKWETLADLGTDVTSFESDLGKKCELRTSFQCLGNFIDLKMGFELPWKQEQLSEEYSVPET